jgi:hypothetical protein
VTAATGLARANGDVWEVGGDVLSVCEKGEGEGRSESTGRGRAPSCPGRVHERPGTFWASRARHFPGVARVSSVDVVYRRDQCSEVSVQDMVRGAGEDGRRKWHDDDMVHTA